MLTKFLFLLLGLGASVHASESRVENNQLSLALGFHRSAVQNDSLSQTLLYRRPFTGWLSGELGFRANESFVALEALHYKLEPTASPFSWLDVSLRLATSGYPADGMGNSILMLSTRFHGQPLDWFKVSFTAGYFERFIRLGGFPVLFNFSRDVPDNDFAANLALRFLISERWNVGGDVGTFDGVQVYNLHNPFGRLVLSFQDTPQSWKFSAFVRYRILLGFGRLDELFTGAGAEFPFELF